MAAVLEAVPVAVPKRPPTVAVSCAAFVFFTARAMLAAPPARDPSALRPANIGIRGKIPPILLEIGMTRGTFIFFFHLIFVNLLLHPSAQSLLDCPIS